jgi:hypothetical protein
LISKRVEDVPRGSIAGEVKIPRVVLSDDLADADGKTETRFLASNREAATCQRILKGQSGEN